MIAAGADVDVVCPPLHPILKITGFGRRHGYSMLSGRHSLRRAISAQAPDLIIASDEIAAEHLTTLGQTALKVGSDRSDLVGPVARSMGSLDAHQLLSSRVRQIELAGELGIRAPKSASIASAAELEQWLADHGAPAFVKLDGTHGGDGVREITDASQARALFEEMTRQPGLMEIIRQILKRQIFSKAALRLGLQRPSVSVQKAVAGVPANCTFACWQGELLANISVEVLRTTRTNGVASHVRTIDCPDMTHAAAAIARRLGLSGIHGLDFILEEATGQPWLIEMNARPTQISHLRLGPDRDPIGALLAAAGGSPVPARPVAGREVTLALFPHQLREPRETWAGEVDIDDLPHDQPGLIAAFKPRHLGRAVNLLNRVLPAPRRAKPGQLAPDSLPLPEMGLASFNDG